MFYRFIIGLQVYKICNGRNVNNEMGNFKKSSTFALL